MTSITKFTGALRAMRLVNDCEFKILGKENGICNAIRSGIAMKFPYMDIIRMVKDMATDNYNMVADELSIKLTDEILNFEI
jgi:hypothetical protein